MFSIRLFVYGTLRRGQKAHHFLLGQVFEGAAQTLPLYHVYDAGKYPCLVHARAVGHRIPGELWRIDPALLPGLDAYEEASTLFALEPIELSNVEGPVHAYFYQLDVTSFSDRLILPSEMPGIFDHHQG